MVHRLCSARCFIRSTPMSAHKSAVGFPKRNFRWIQAGKLVLANLKKKKMEELFLRDVVGFESLIRASLPPSLLFSLHLWYPKKDNFCLFEGTEPCTIVMDLEGTDGRERGEAAFWNPGSLQLHVYSSFYFIITYRSLNFCIFQDDTAFEKQSALFALAVSDIVLINIPRKTTLIFVIRDKTRTPMENLEPILREDIRKIWDSVPKPEAHKETPLKIRKLLLTGSFEIQIGNFMIRKSAGEDDEKLLMSKFLSVPLFPV
ncbi:hypothetical protein L2E82_44869 [Cichorium intybus]|uniref:Uncharacterized protein n=1 Tax=Cichorium intybus TaxID=13427 RepID=A0ACB8ZSR3_CICIN|nr:hypothetical protein L2E82_44869 [Cichorium intybus]